MNTPRYAAAAAKLLRQNLADVNPACADRTRGLATIERAMHARSRRRRLFLLGASLAVAAGVVTLATRLRSWPTPHTGSESIAINVTPSGQGAALARGDGEQPLTAHSSIGSGQRIETPADGGASLQLSTGTSMTLAGRTSFRVDSQGAIQRFTLQQGELEARVAKLLAAQRFIVDTPDAEVEVRGTRFRLRVIAQSESCGAGTRTRLDVSEGVVEVRAASLGTVRVKAGESWPAECAAIADATQLEAVQPPSARQATAARRREGRPATSAPLKEAERASGLTAPNDLFADGVARARQGDSSGALRVYQELMTRFPSSPLAENAMVARMRLLSTTAAGATEAKRYLARYPHGFAVQEAKKVLAEP